MRRNRITMTATFSNIRHKLESKDISKILRENKISIETKDRATNKHHWIYHVTAVMNSLFPNNTVRNLALVQEYRNVGSTDVSIAIGIEFVGELAVLNITDNKHVTGGVLVTSSCVRNIGHYTGFYDIIQTICDRYSVKYPKIELDGTGTLFNTKFYMKEGEVTW